MEQLNDRYNGAATVIHSYKTEFIVECPRCKHAAFITASNPWFLNDGKLNCSHCSYCEKAVDMIRYKVSVKVYCADCGTLINKVIPHSKEKVNDLAISCSNCGSTEVYRARNDEYIISYNIAGLGLDPIFHLPLWLQENIRGNLLWAYNRSHLHDIKEYVEAKLHERQTTRYTTMVEKLPTFIKEAKNREAILKAIEKMERK
jgi:DNA-directed RNA polymerase subunit RPC12/RpoP